MLDDKHLIELGRVAEQAAAVDFILLRVLCALVSDDPEVGRVAFSKLSSSAALDRVVPLASIRDLTELLRDALKEWVKESQKALQDRNALIHGQWIRGSSSAEFGQVRGRNKGVELLVEVLPEEIQIASLALETAYLQGMQYWFDITLQLGIFDDASKDLLQLTAAPFSGEDS